MMTEPCRKRAASLFVRAFWALLTLTLVIVPAVARADNAQYFYDPGGRLIGMIDPTNGSATYSYDAAGNITSITRTPSTTMGVVQFFPTTGPVGTSVTISGTAFTGGTTTVKFGTVTATPTSTTANQIVVPVPSGVTGPVAITISTTSPAGSIVTSTNFTVASPTAAPTVTSFSPGTQIQGSAVTITGTNFDTNSANDKAWVNGQAAQITGATATTLTVNVPPSSSGKIVVATPAGSSAPSANDLIVPPPGFTVADVFTTMRTTFTAAPAQVSTGAPGTVSLLLFDVTQLQRISLLLDPSSAPGCGNVSILGPAGAPLLPVGGVCSSNWYSFLMGLPAGTYTAAFAPNASGTGYFFTGALYDVPPDTTASATVGGAAQTLYISAPGQGGSFTFTGTAGQRVAIQLDTRQVSTCVFDSIQNPDGTYLVAPGQRSCFDEFYASGPPVVLPQTGTYTIYLTTELDGRGPAIGTGRISTTILNVPADLSTTATMDGGPVYQNITGSGQNASVSFTVTAPKRFNILINTRSLYTPCATISVLMPDGVTYLVAPTFQCNSVYLNGTVLNATVSGTYKIQYQPEPSGWFPPGTGRIVTSLTSVPADLTGTITVDGAPVRQSVTAAGQLASLNFTISAVKKVNIWMDFTGQSSDCGDYSILMPDGVTFLVPLTRGCAEFYVNSAAIPLTVTGTYKINYTPELNNYFPGPPGPFTTKIFTVPADPSASVPINGTTVTQAVTTPNQHATMTFNVPSLPQAVAPWFDFDKLAGGCADASILNPDGVTYLLPLTHFCGSYFANYTDQIPYALTNTGTYTVSIVPDMSSKLMDGTGLLAAAVFGNTGDITAPVTVGGPTVALTLPTPGQRGVYTLNNTTAGSIVKVSFDLSRMTNCNTLSVLSPDGTTYLLSPTDTCATSYQTGALTLAQTGTYKLIDQPDLVNGNNAGRTPGGTGWLGATVTAGP